MCECVSVLCNVYSIFYVNITVLTYGSSIDIILIDFTKIEKNTYKFSTKSKFNSYRLSGV